MDTLSWTIETEPNPADVEFLEDRINEYNSSTTGITDARSLALFERDAEGHILAGLYGWTWGGTCEVRFLWVAACLRGKGRGRRILTAAEEEAVRRGCAQIVLSTHSFQAPEFYFKMGYATVGQYGEYPAGHMSYFLRKPLTAR
ncbi:MAG TPA: GNAT family N-acetyltransferase [Acidobacteriota bacterium]|nr:GNAT family N-acetyltransferase [Acidobacteriota bacterium]